jgi:hypothetical protein
MRAGEGVRGGVREVSIEIVLLIRKRPSESSQDASKLAVPERSRPVCILVYTFFSIEHFSLHFDIVALRFEQRHEF